MTPSKAIREKQIDKMPCILLYGYEHAVRDARPGGGGGPSGAMMNWKAGKAMAFGAGTP